MGTDRDDELSDTLSQIGSQTTVPIDLTKGSEETVAFLVDPHTGPFDKAAMLLRGITAGHPFQDSNKRTGFLLAAFFLEQQGYDLPDPLPVDETEALCLRVSSGAVRDVEQIARELQRIWTRAGGESS